MVVSYGAEKWVREGSIVVNPSLNNFVKIQEEYLEHFFLQAKNFQVKQIFATSERCQEGKEINASLQQKLVCVR